MSSQEKRRKFNEAVVNMLFPPPPPPPHPQDGDEPLNILSEGFDAELFSGPKKYELGLGEIGSSTTSDEDDDGGGGGGGGNDSGSQKLTRAQRKRLRKKKLKEDASRRRKIIGPLLPPHNDKLENDPPTVRCYAAEEAFDKPGEPSNLGPQNKLKQRRMAKKLARKSLKVSSEEDCHQYQNLSSADEQQA
ncbi:uncharacterized protein LOC107424921 isoform X2 [Ziziphus jujuba]|uniref:Uncharacterized protein LOC107424921 isoform X2 n=1 Tax=Ziziphus jujuba TaxID=326968 RepID=A0A6P6GD89_ZIZJJ|nr:uncharacterized protein LOC107424921 isoform X2 [Ziziphus jujuba]